MIKSRKKYVAFGVAIMLGLIFSGCGKNTLQMEKAKYPDATVIELDESKAVVDGTSAQIYDYKWNCDPGNVHDEVADAPAEYYTGTKPQTDAAVYIDQELYYYPQLNENKFQLVDYDGEREWAYYYTDGVNEDYIFATLPNLRQQIQTQMMHSEKEASENKVLHITKPGKYVLVGNWKGQIKVDCGEQAYEDEMAKVTLILDGADVNCSVAPGIIFQNVYECDNTWEEVERKDATVDTTSAGANIILSDNSENHISGANVFRMLKTKYKDEDAKEEIKQQKKMRKTDGALYSFMTMQIDGEENGTGSLVVDSTFEGIDSELHLAIKGGNITVNSQDDGMNVNEDHTSVIAFLGGETTIHAALGAEGDGVDSNGYILIDGGTVSVDGIRPPDSALDSEDGIYYNEGKIVLDGEVQAYEPGDVIKETRGGGMGRLDMPNQEEFNPGAMNPNGPGAEGEKNPRMLPPEDFDLKEFKEKVAQLSDDATFEDVMSLLRGDNK